MSQSEPKKVSKPSVDYSAGKMASHCGNCTHFTPGPDPLGQGTCEKVDGGILWYMWCRLWRRKRA